MIIIIISASRRTDIPAFYSEWFINRINEGYFIKVNPYNSKQRKEVSLLPADVDVIIFWTKNPLPLMKRLSTLDQKGYRYLFYYTLNDYPKILEPRVPALPTRIDTFKQLGDRIGSPKVIWRYDPIIISSLTPVDYHLERFGNLAKAIRGYSERVVISFLALYEKVQSKLKKFEKANTFQVNDIRTEDQWEQLKFLVGNLAITAAENGLEIYSCSEKLDLDSCNLQHGSCIDIKLINRVFDLELTVKKDKYQRPECLCAESVDMGFYDTCKYDCLYCYANTSSKAVLNNIEKHDPKIPVLLGR